MHILHFNLLQTGTILCFIQIIILVTFRMFTRINPLIRFLNKDEIPRMSVLKKILKEHFLRVILASYPFYIGPWMKLPFFPHFALQFIMRLGRYTCFVFRRSVFKSRLGRRLFSLMRRTSRDILQPLHANTSDSPLPLLSTYFPLHSLQSSRHSRPYN